MDSKRDHPPYLQAHLKTAPSAQRPKFLKELAKPTQEGISNFFSTRKKIKTPDTQAQRQKGTRTMTVTHMVDNDRNNSTDRTPAGNSVFATMAG